MFIYQINKIGIKKIWGRKRDIASRNDDWYSVSNDNEYANKGNIEQLDVESEFSISLLK